MELWEESLTAFREVRDAVGVVMCLMNVGLVALAQGDVQEAPTPLREGLRRARDLDHKGFKQYCIIGLASAAASLGHPIRAARLWGAALRLAGGSASA